MADYFFAFMLKFKITPSAISGSKKTDPLNCIGRGDFYWFEAEKAQKQENCLLFLFTPWNNRNGAEKIFVLKVLKNNYKGSNLSDLNPYS